MKRSERLQSLTESLRRAGSRGRTAQQLADGFEVTIRTIKREISALEAGGLPVWARTGPGGGYGLTEMFRSRIRRVLRSSKCLTYLIQCPVGKPLSSPAAYGLTSARQPNGA
ncbi:helix-turn-helix transcriptional regulator [Cryobacterium sp. Y82]|uniref:helix-turn-helix transcriptional regulator n=1 Tax=Cryobacterium sp. Y82 TaxID=2045017 RepID=UPI0035192DD1